MRNYFTAVIYLLVLFNCACEESDDIKSTDEFPASVLPHSDLLNNGNWEIMNPLSDEFNDDSLNLNKWVNLYPGWNGRFPSWFVSDNAILNSGDLNIIMKHEQLPQMEEGYEYSTGVIRSVSSFKYGYCEIRAKCMSSAGSSAFFLNNVQADWWTEIDVFEIGGNAVGYEYTVNTNLHEFYNPNNVITAFVFNIETHYSDAYSPVFGWRPDADYHIYGLEWGIDSIKWYVDGNLIRESENVKWHQEQYINIDSETMPDWLGLPSNEDLPSVFYVDYIRTWQKS